MVQQPNRRAGFGLRRETSAEVEVLTAAPPYRHREESVSQAESEAGDDEETQPERETRNCLSTGTRSYATSSMFNNVLIIYNKIYIYNKKII